MTRPRTRCQFPRRLWTRRTAAEALADAGIAWAIAAPAGKEFPLGQGLVRVAIRRDNDLLRIEATGMVGRSIARREIDEEVDP
ncbi:MAG: hypothetical protein JXP34_19100 [Planctomycetes bacterium]|nr:hypothetical protein [Planctomycetota bacterium]